MWYRQRIHSAHLSRKTAPMIDSLIILVSLQLEPIELYPLASIPVIQIILMLCCLVLVHKIRDDLPTSKSVPYNHTYREDAPRIIEFSEILGKHWVLLVLVQVRANTPRLIVLSQHARESLCSSLACEKILDKQTYHMDTRMIRNHQAAHPMIRLNVGRFLGKSHLNRRRTPRYKVCQLSFPDPQQRFVNLRRTVRSARHNALKQLTSVGSTSP
mgnify:CR=1 FL=1